MRRFLIMLAAVMMILAVSCEQPQTDSRSSVTFGFDSNVADAKGFAPPTATTETASYRIAGDGPDSESFGPSTYQVGGNVTISELVTGEWTFTVQALNVAGDVVAEGSATKTLAPGNNRVQIVLAEPKGIGYFSLDVVWNPNDLPALSSSSTVRVQVSVTDSFGVETNLSPTVRFSDGTASVSSYPLFTGNYTLSVSLTDSGTRVWGAVESVRISRYALTEGFVSFFTDDDIVLASLQVVRGYTPALNCSITTSSNVFLAGTSMKLTCETDYDGPIEDLTWQWYRNGRIMTGSTADFIRYSMTTGTSRYDCLVKKGNECVGSAHRTITVL